MKNAQHIESWYAASIDKNPDYSILSREISTDVCIIGGGYTGLSTAIHLRERGYEVVVLEANRVAWGASGRNGGHVGTGQRAEQEVLEKMVGMEHARGLWQLGLESVDTVCELIDRFDIDCELKHGNLYVASKAADAAGLAAEAAHLQDTYGYTKMRYVAPSELAQLTSGLGFHGGLLDTGSKHLHPLKYALGLAKAAHSLGTKIHEKTRALSYTEGDAVRVKTA